MKTLTREEVKKAFYEIVNKYGKPTSGNIYCANQLISAICHDLCAYGETHISFEYGKFDVSPALCVKAAYGSDHTFIGTVKAVEWYTPEQIRALHEVAFGYQF